jgi:hypothetical protein
MTEGARRGDAIDGYLGGGLNASFDGHHQIRLQARVGGDHWVGLEPENCLSLLAFLRDCWPEESEKAWERVSKCFARK